MEAIRTVDSDFGGAEAWAGWGAGLAGRPEAEINSPSDPQSFFLSLRTKNVSYAGNPGQNVAGAAGFYIVFGPKTSCVGTIWEGIFTFGDLRLSLSS